MKFRFCKYAREKIEKLIFIHICFWLIRSFVNVESIATQTFRETTHHDIDRKEDENSIEQRSKREENREMFSHVFLSYRYGYIHTFSYIIMIIADIFLPKAMEN